MSCGRKICKCKLSNTKSLRQMIIEDLIDSSMSQHFSDASEEDKKAIEEDIKELIKTETNYPTYKATPRSMRTELLVQSVIFILFDE